MILYKKLVLLPDEEESVNAKSTVRNRLEPKFFFDHFAQFHVVSIFKNNDTRMT